MPPRDDQTTLLFDSVAGGPHRPAEKGPGSNDSLMYILYDLCQAYPEYIVEYEDPHRRQGRQLQREVFGVPVGTVTDEGGSGTDVPAPAQDPGAAALPESHGLADVRRAQHGVEESRGGEQLFAGGCSAE